MLVVLPVSMLLAWLVLQPFTLSGHAVTGMLLIMSPYLIGPIAGIVALWTILQPWALGRPRRRELDCWQFVGLTVSVCQALVMASAAVTPSMGQLFGTTRIVFLYLMGSAIAVAMHVACSHQLVLSCCRCS